MDDLNSLYCAFTFRTALQEFQDRLPPSISNLAGYQLDNVASAVQQVSAAHPSILTPLLALVLGRLRAGWQLIRIAVRVAETDVAAKVARSSMAQAVVIVLADLRAMVDQVRGQLRAGRTGDAVATLKEAHDSIRGVRTELNLSGDTGWGRELAGLRAKISDLLTSEIENAPSRLRRLLRPRTDHEIHGESVLDPLDVEEMLGQVELVVACRNFAGELAMNEIAPRVHAEMETHLNSAVSTLSELIRTARPDEFTFRRSQADAAIRFAGKLFNPDYTAVLAKQVNIALSDRTAVPA